MSLKKNGDTRTVLLSGSFLNDMSEKNLGGVAVLQDITEQKLLQAQLRQSQKLEAVGQLAGGYLIELEKVQLKYLKVGPFRQPDVTVAVIESRGPDSGIDGLLGMDFLKHRHYRIDYVEQLLLWEEPVCC